MTSTLKQNDLDLESRNMKYLLCYIYEIEPKRPSHIERTSIQCAQLFTSNNDLEAGQLKRHCAYCLIQFHIMCEIFSQLNQGLLRF